ncbi:ABC transporter ATP-binding protein [Pelagibacterium xiamenense]|uniref:ABC transporter ATP-binding protein n=1 Tax=Pelagibacterium xiamenense TaxID=2901140 RepID=UPI001E3BE621|nr:ABC transporter ATP-binding protein [Pelagibacterium xiamenense]MCD7060186.1 ABC transporter ATP-binding protein [Pelagibacterium xiamenense]
MKPLLSIDSVGMRFDALQVLNDISLRVAEGEFVTILGPSGAGKSTLFQLLLGEHRPTSGAITFRCAPLERKTNAFAYMPQRDALMPWRRIIDNLTLGLEVQGMPRKAAREKVRPLLPEFGLEGFERHYPSQLSGGMRQRAALLRTVVQDRPMLLLDEPFGALDALTRTRMQAWLETLWAHHSWTAMLITHDVREAVHLSDRIYVLSARPGRVLREIPVALPRPRTADPATARRAQAIEADILDFLLKHTTP